MSSPSTPSAPKVSHGNYYLNLPNSHSRKSLLLAIIIIFNLAITIHFYNDFTIHLRNTKKFKTLTKTNQSDTLLLDKNTQIPSETTPTAPSLEHLSETEVAPQAIHVNYTLQNNPDLLDFIWLNHVVPPAKLITEATLQNLTYEMPSRPTHFLSRISIEGGEMLTRIIYSQNDDTHSIFIECNPHYVPLLRRAYPAAWIVNACISTTNTTSRVAYKFDPNDDHLSQQLQTFGDLLRPAFPLFSILSTFGPFWEVDSLKLYMGGAEKDILLNYPIADFPIKHIEMNAESVTLQQSVFDNRLTRKKPLLPTITLFATKANFL